MVDRLLRNLHPASQLFLTDSARCTFTMGEETEDNNNNAGSCDLKALPNDIAQVSIKEYFEDRDNNFKVVDVRTREEYCEDRWEMTFESCFFSGCLGRSMCPPWMSNNGGRCRYWQPLTCQEPGLDICHAPSFLIDGFFYSPD